MPAQQKGFTLMELMVVIAIISIIAAIGYPSYIDYTVRAKRADAISMLSSAAGEQFRFYTENNRYATDMQELGYPTATVDTENGLYNVSVSASTATTFTLSAAPISGKSQENDADLSLIHI